METVRLTPHSRLRRLVKTSRLRLTGVLQTLETRGTVRENSSLGVPAQPHKTEHRSNKQQHKIDASLRPKGPLSPLKGTIATKATSCQLAGGLTRMLQEILLRQQI